ncbi:hypothetical protein SEUCBS140593_002349 [Sporothrix eucalyptigena]|uniref:Zn(2)-C6 fungal-type domain-containing protein n=1 Tax=Sporothrix eucalyptigena TaxID=1812306 RepID=A0ABP0B5R0_9PEZI
MATTAPITSALPPAASALAEPEVRRRRRPAVSCTLCRRRKIRCNREQPCSNCLRARKNVACVYEELPPLPTASEKETAPKPAGRQPFTEGIVFRDAPPAPNPPQTVTPTSTGTVEGQSRSAQSTAPQKAPNSAVFGLTGFTVADFSAAHTPRNASAPTTGPTSATSAVPSLFDHEVIMGMPEFQTYGSAAREAHHAQQPHQGHRSGHHSGDASGHASSHTSPEDVQSMQQRIRHLEAQLKDERRHPEKYRESHRHDRRDYGRDSRGRTRRPRGSIEAVPDLPHLVVNEALDNVPMAYMTVEEPPPPTSRSYQSRRPRRSRRSYRPHRSRDQYYRSTRWSLSRSPRSLSPRSPRSSRSRSRSSSRSRLRHVRPRQESRRRRRSWSLRSRSPTPRHHRRSQSRSQTRSQSYVSRPVSRSPSLAFHAHPHIHSGDASTTLTPGNPMSDHGQHHHCFQDGNFMSNNNYAADAPDKNKIKTTEDRGRTPSVVNWPTKPSSIAGDFFVSTRGHSYGPREHRMHMTSRSVMHKTRLFGQSHWVNSIVGFRDIFEMIDPLVTDSTASKVFVDMQRLKHIGRIIKALRVGPSWPPPPMPTPMMALPSSVTLHEAYGLPPRALADELVECYLRSTESLYRILHVPMFRREYEALWTVLRSSATTAPLTKADLAFVVQLKLVLAIGCATHREHVALRTRAVRWFYTAQAWFAEPEYKAHLTMQILQIHLLLLFAREATGIGGALIWISVGDLVRSAVYMGLHRDPDRLPKRMSRLAAEMRRRLWNTILEVVVFTSLDAGGPAMLSVTDFDARPPSNIDDEALEESALAENAAAKAAAVAAAATGATGPSVLRPNVGETGAEFTKNAVKNNCAKEIYVDDGGMRGVPEPKSAAELLEQEKRMNGEWISGGVGVNKTDQAGGDGPNGQRAWKKRFYVDPGTPLSRAPGAICPALRDNDRTLQPERNCHDNGDDGALGDGEGEGQRRKSRSPEDPSGAASPVARPLSEFTSMSVPVALRKTLPLRLAICKFLNDMGPPGTYADTLRFDRQFRSVYRSLSDTLQKYTVAAAEDNVSNSASPSASSRSRPKIDNFTVASVHLIMRRFLLCLHIPFFGASMQEETAYAYSRRVVSDTAVRIWHTSCPGIVDTSVPTVEAADFAANEARQNQTPPAGRMLVDPALVRQTLLGAGALRRLAMQASLLVAAEAKFQLVEDDNTDATGTGGSGRAPIRPDLLAIIQAASHWCLRSIEAGETNFKGYLLWRLIEKQLDGMRRSMMAAPTASTVSRMALARELVQAAEEAETMCMPILDAMLARGQQEAHEAAVAAYAMYGMSSYPFGFGTEVNNLVRMCRVEDCTCQTVFRQQQQQQQQQALEAAQLAEQQQNLQNMSTNMSTQPPFMPGIQQPLDPMAIDFTVDNWEFIMPDAQSLNIGSGEPLSWLFSGEASQGILW